MPKRYSLVILSLTKVCLTHALALIYEVEIRVTYFNQRTWFLPFFYALGQEKHLCCVFSYENNSYTYKVRASVIRTFTTCSISLEEKKKFTLK
jgi:hypothetical protein